jgi:flagellar protein FlaI
MSNEIHLRKEKKNINVGNVFRKAVKGYKLVGEREIVRAPMQTIIPTTIEIRQEPKEGKKEIEGIPITEAATYMRKKEPEINLKGVNIIYPLIPKASKNPFAAANIRWSKAESSLVYYVIEPQLMPQEKDLLEKIKQSLIEKLDVDFTQIKKEEARSYLKVKFEEMITLMAAGYTVEKQQQFLYFIERDFVGLGKIEPLMQDGDIEDISCDGIGIPIFIYHRNSSIGSVRTNIVFESKDELDIFVNKLSQRCGKSISVAQPLVGGSLPDGSRIQATLGTDIARKGSNFSIRKFTEEPLTPIHMLKSKTLNPKIAAYLWLAIEYGRSILISGGVATGKTTLLNALSLFIKPELKVVSIEDTPELRLPHPHWVPQVARQPIAEIEGRSIGEVDLFDLLRESLRQRPDYLIVGEVRGKEAYVLFQQIATGHASMSTIHADSMERLLDRLTTPPISLPPNLIEALDIVVFLVRIKYGNTYVRRISSIYEIIGFDREKNYPIVNEVFRWNPQEDTYSETGNSIVLKKISNQYGLTEQDIQREIGNRVKVIKWLFERDVADYRSVAKVVKLYYTRAEELLSAL